MTLQEIETLVLATIKYDAYSALSVDPDPQKVLDFATLHQCVWLAREEIKKNCIIANLLKYTAAIPISIVNTQNLIPEPDFDIPMKVFYTDINSNVWELRPVSPENIAYKFGSIPVGTAINLFALTGVPSFYMMFGSNASGLSYIEVFPLSTVAGETITIVYKPILSPITTSTGTDVIMRKYPMTVMKLASAYAFQMIKSDKEGHATWLKLGYADFPGINVRELGVDNDSFLIPDSLLQVRRVGRNTI